MGRYPLAPRHHVAQPYGMQSQVAVFPKGSREALVEAAGRNQGCAPIGYVGGNPRRTHEPFGKTASASDGRTSRVARRCQRCPPFFRFF